MENMKLQLVADQHNVDIKVHDHFSHLKSMDEVLPYRTPQTELSGVNVSDMEKSNAELLGRLKELQDYTDAYADEKQSLIEQIEKYEEELSMSETQLKSKANELDDAMFSLHKEREKWLTERSALVESAGRSLPTSANDEDVKSLIEVNERLREKIISLTNELNDATQQLHADIVGGSGESEEQVSRLTLLHENHECKQKISDLSKELDDLRRQVGNTNNELAELNTENTRLKDEARDLTNGFDECLERVNDLTDKLISERLVKSEAENSELTERLEVANSKIGDLLGDKSSQITAAVGVTSNDYHFDGKKHKFLEVKAMAASKEEALHASLELDKLTAENTQLKVELRGLANNTKINDLSNELLATKQKLQAVGGMLTKYQAENAELVAYLDAANTNINAANTNIKDLHDQLLTTKKELKIQEKAQAQIRLQFDRLQTHVETLTDENSELQRARESLQVRARTLEQLLSTASTDRDNLMESNTKLLAKFSVLSYDRDEAVGEKEHVKRKLDRIAANFEAGEYFLLTEHVSLSISAHPLFVWFHCNI
jgi:chromosome segregation ATPase